jgi:hypothetical protein
VSLSGVLEAVVSERLRQDAKWGEQNHPDGTASEYWREFGVSADAARAAYENSFRAGKGTWLDVLLEEIAEAFEETDPEKLRAELVQVAAVTVAWIEAIDRRGGA